MNLHNVISHPLMTEATSLLMEKENKLVFIVHIKSNKKEVKRAIEEIYGVKVDRVNTLITPKGEKKAFIKLNSEYKAADLAIRLGVL